MKQRTKNKINRLLPNHILNKKIINKNSEDIDAVISFFRSQETMDSDKLTGLCYYAYIWSLVVLGKEIAPFKFIKTKEGIVEESIYISYSNTELLQQALVPRLTVLQRNFLITIYRQYSRFTGKEMKEKIANHTPYIESEGIIDKMKMYRFYTQFV